MFFFSLPWSLAKPRHRLSRLFRKPKVSAAWPRGGRGGQVIHVTNLNDSGEGSLRACAEAAGPRTCVFQLSGIVDLIDRIKIENPYLTLAGQTAPGEGITIRGMLSLRTHDIIIRHVRVRPGPRLIPSPSNLDAIQISDPGQNIILDHVSMSWATDEVFSVWGGLGGSAQDISIQCRSGTGDSFLED